MSQKPWLIKALRNPYRAFCCYSNVSSAVTGLIIENKLSKQQSTRYRSIPQLLNRSQTFSGHPVLTVSSETGC